MKIEELYEKLKKLHEPKGFFFNNDKEKVFDLLQALLINKSRYGYISCPCRLSYSNREQDKDIICPCVYSKDDIAEYGSCYCNLYVTKEWNDNKIKHFYVPERRALEIF